MSQANQPYEINDIDHAEIIALATQAMDGDQLKVMATDFYRQFSQKSISVFCMHFGLYCLPTIELLDVLNRLIMEVSPSRNAIEIGSGNGAIGRGLGIPATDNFMQDDPTISSLYQAQGQATIKYGTNVTKIDGNRAVKEMRPDVVIAAWVTHKYDERRPQHEGNMFGVVEEDILKQVKRYVVVGNKQIHKQKPIMPKVSQVIEGDFLISRSLRFPGENAIFVWDSSTS
ncbi:hypothetical protein ACYPKM_01140 [Pseudomonas aeruginosa]